MQTKYFVKPLWLVIFLFFGSRLAMAQIGTAEDPVIIDGQNNDILGGIANTTLDRLTREKIKKGVLRPLNGTEDLFLTPGTETIIDVTEYGPTCLTAYPGGIIGSPDAPRKPGDPPSARTIKAGNQLGSAQLVVTRDPTGKGRCTEESGELLKVFRFTVTTADIFKALQELDALIGEVEGLVIRVVGDRVVLDGKIIVPSELERLQTVVKNFNAGKDDKAKIPILSLYEMSPISYKLIADKMEEEIAGGPDRPRDITVRALNGRFFLEGSVDQRSDRQRALKVCRAYLQKELIPNADGVLRPAKVDQSDDPTALKMCNNSIWIRQGQPTEPDPVMSIRADFVTLNKSYLKEFEFYWRPTLAAEGSLNYTSDAGRFTSGFLGTVRRLFPVLKTAATHGYGRVLKSATVILVDKPDATGNNIPNAVISEVFSVPYVSGEREDGTAIFATSEIRTSVNIKAKTVPGSDKIEMAVIAEQTQSLGSSSGVPQTLTNSVDTKLVVTNGESAALGGMIGDSRNVAYDRSPGSDQEGNFEVFGLGRGHSLQDQKSQFLVFITPIKMKNPGQGTTELKRKFRLRK